MIHGWLRSRFDDSPEAKTFFELGAHCGSDTVRLASIPGTTVHAFEPDPRNEVPDLPNVVFNRSAVGERDGVGRFYPSATRGGKPWTCSGSLFLPTGHLEAYPDVDFGESIDVDVVSLDSYVSYWKIEQIDFIWADVQGAEAAVIRGATETLKRTRFLFTEYCDFPLYDGQLPLFDLLKLLPNWHVLATYPSGEAYADVLLENLAFTPACGG